MKNTFLLPILGGLLFLAFVPASFSQAPCAPNTMYAMSTTGNVFSLDLGTGIATPICGPITVGCHTELEFVPGSGGTFVAQQCNGNFVADIVDDISTCNVAAAGVANAHAFTGLEYVGTTLYGAGIDAGGGGAPSTLYTLDPLTGASVAIGLTGVGPITGLAYDAGTGTMYGTAGGGGTDFYTIDLATGAATLVGSTGVVLGSLAFDSNGNLFGGGGQANAGNLYSIDPATGASTLIGATGIGATISGLALCSSSGATAAVPTMGEWGLIILALLVLSFGTVFMMRRRTAIVGMGETSMSQGGGVPFDQASFGKMLLTVMVGLAVVFTVAVLVFGYEMTNADVPGSLIAAPIAAYLLHLLLGGKE